MNTLIKIIRKLNCNKQLSAGALQFTMYIVIVIAILLAAFIILVHTQKTFKLQTNLTLETIENTNKGMNYALQNDNISLKDTIQVKLQEHAHGVVEIQKDLWGIYEKITAVSRIKNKQFKKIALVGGNQPENRVALYLEDNNRPLVLVGHTKIQGSVYLPQHGLRTGNISGHAYYGNQLIYGNTKTSKAALPKLSNGVKKSTEYLKTKIKTVSQNQFLDLDISNTFQNSFNEPLKVVYGLEDILLFGKTLIGNIVVQSETKIIVDATTKLKDVILMAPEIEIKNQVKGTFQAFASKKIVIGTGCQLYYPSALVLEEVRPIKMDLTHSKEVKLKETPFIHLKKNATIKGSIIYQGFSKNYKPQVLIEKNATIIGEIYCNKNTELLGSVYGSVYTAGFVANQSGSIYQNHIYNGIIEIDRLAKEYVGVSFENTKKGIAKWLY